MLPATNELDETLGLERRIASASGDAYSNRILLLVNTHIPVLKYATTALLFHNSSAARQQRDSQFDTAGSAPRPRPLALARQDGVGGRLQEQR